jgi:hypothetical protein
MASRVLEVILQAKDAASATIGKVEGSVTGAVGRMGLAFKALGALAAGAALGKFFKDSIEEATKAELSVGRLGVAVRNAGGDFGPLRPALEDTIKGIVRLTKHTDDDLRQALTNMVTLTGDVTGSQKNLALVADLAAARQIDLSTASDLVSKAMNGNVTGLNRLGFAGKDATVVLDNLRASVGGFAEQEGQTFGGVLTRITNQWGEFKEAVGLAIIGTDGVSEAGSGLVNVLAGMAKFVEDNSEAIQAFVSAIVAMGKAVWAVASGPLKILATAFLGLLDVLSVVLEGVGTFAKAAGGLFEKIGIEWVSKTGDAVAAAGTAMHKAAVNGYKAIWSATKGGEKAATDAAKAGATDRARVSEGEAKARAKASDDYAKEKLKVETEIAVKSLQIQEGITESEAREQVGRRQQLGQSLGVTIRDLESGYARIDALNAKLASGWTRHLQGVADSFGDITPKVKDTTRALEMVAIPAGKAASGVEDVAEAGKKSGLSLEDGARAAIGFADGLGLIDDAASAAMQNITTLGSSIAQVAGGDWSGLTGILGGLTGILGSIFGGGESPEEKARKDLLRKNTEALRDLTAGITDLGDVSSAGGMIQQVGSALQNYIQTWGTNANPVDMWQWFTDNFGLSRGDIESVAGDLGIELFDKNGRLVPGVFQQLLAGIQSLQTEGQQFDWDEFRSWLDAALGGGAVDPVNVWGQALNQLFTQRFGGGRLEGLADFDVTTAEGRAGAGSFLQGLLADLPNLTAGDLGGFNLSDFTEAIQFFMEQLNVEGVGTGWFKPNLPRDPDRPPLDLGAAFGDLSVSFADIGTQQVDYLASIDAGIGTLITRWTDIDTGAVVTAPRAVTVQVGDIYVQGGPTSAETGAAVQEAVTAAINEALAEAYREDRLATGDVTRSLT